MKSSFRTNLVFLSGYDRAPIFLLLIYHILTCIFIARGKLLNGQLNKTELAEWAAQF